MEAAACAEPEGGGGGDLFFFSIFSPQTLASASNGRPRPSIGHFRGVLGKQKAWPFGPKSIEWERLGRSWTPHFG